MKPAVKSDARGRCGSVPPGIASRQARPSPERMERGLSGRPGGGTPPWDRSCGHAAACLPEGLEPALSSLPRRCPTKRGFLRQILLSAAALAGTLGVSERSPRCGAPFSIGPCAAQPPAAVPPNAAPVQGGETDDDGDDKAELEGGLYLPVDRQLQRTFASALRMVSNERWSDAATLLDEVLASDSDAFIPPAAAGAEGRVEANPDLVTWRSVKTLAAEAIAGMNREGREAYDLQFRARAERGLAEALEAHAIDGVLAVARRWFHTPAGAAAAMLVAIDRVEAGDAIGAAHWLGRLSESPGASRFEPTLSVLRAVASHRAGDRTTAEALLDQVRRGRRTDLRIAGRNESLAAVSGIAADWLEKRFGAPSAGAGSVAEDWLFFRGNAARNAVDSIGREAPSPGIAARDEVLGSARPLLAPRYRVPLARHPEEARGWERRRKSLVDRDASRMPSGSPLVVGQKVLAMSPGGLLAIDFRSGKRIWLAPSPFPEAEASAGPLADPIRQSAIDFEPVFDDATAGGLASDGRLVFAVESPALPAIDPTAVFQGGLGAAQGGAAVRSGNALSAYRVEDGSLAWRLPRSVPGGAAAIAVPDDRATAGDGGAVEAAVFAGWIVGPPLPVGEELFVLVEHQGGLRLDAIDSSTGLVHWSQPLADLDDDLSVLGGRGTGRRIAGLSPSMADGILVCPTGAGAVIAVDLSTRTLRWAYRYPAAEGEAWMRMGNGMLVRRGNGVVAVVPGQGVPVTPNAPSGRRRDGHAVLADGRVVIAPRESDAVHCLDLATGAVRWRRSAENCLYIAGIQDGRVVLVGQHAVEARRLSDGADAWRGPVSLGDASPSGRGFLSRDRLYLPLETPEVLEIDLTSGRVLGRSPARNGGIPGNLVAHRGEVISQGIDSLDVFHRADRLLRGIEAAGTDDGWNSYWMGQLLLDAGRISDGLEAVSRAHERSPDAIGADMVAESVLFGLRRDFATASRYWRKAVARLTGPIADEILRHVVDGALASGDTTEAWEAYRRLAGLDASAEGGGSAAQPWPMESAADGSAQEDRLIADPSDAAVACLPERWLRGRLGRLRAAAQGPLVATIERTVAGGFDLDPAAGGDAAANQAWRFLERFAGGDDTTRAALTFLADRTAGAADGPRSELGRQRRDLARLKLFHLDSRAGSGVGGAARASVDSSDDRATQPSAPAPAAGWTDASWPVGQVAAEHIGQSANGRNSQRLQRPSRVIPIACIGGMAPAPEGLALGPVRLAIDTQAGSAVVVSDGFGRRIGEPMSVDDAAGRFAMVAAMQPSIADASILGRLVVVRFGSTVAGFEVGRDGNRRLWSRADAAALPIQINRQMRVGIRRNAGIPLGMRPVEPADASSAEGDVQAGQAVSDGVPILAQRTLDVRDPLTGRTVWSRSKLPAGAEIFGDDTCVVVCPRDGRGALVLSMIDGQLLAIRDLPPRERRLSTAGRSLVAIQAADAPTGEADSNPPGIDQRSLPGSSAAVGLVSIDPLTDRRLRLGNFPADARATPLEPGRLAVIEPSGRFTLLDVAAGKPLFSVPLEGVPEAIEQVHVLPWEDRLLVAVGRAETAEEQRRLEGLGTISGVPSGGWQSAEETVLLTGSIWAIDRETGEPLWPVPATLLRHGLPLHQPQSLPLLTFVRQIHSPAGEDRPRLSVLCLDKRTGHAVYDDDRAGTDHHPLFSCEIVGNPLSHSVEISRGADRVRLVFDGRPIPPQPPYQATATPASSSGPLGSIGREFEKWMQRAIQSLPF